MSPSWSIDPGGTWSPRQAQAVMAIIRPEAEAQGLEVYAIDITSFGGPARVLICTRPLSHIIGQRSVGELVMQVTFEMDEFNAAITRAQWMLSHLNEASLLYRSRTWWGRLKSWFCDGDAECDW